MPTQDEALNAIGQHAILKVHDDGDMTVRDAEGCLHVITTEGETFTEQSCECLNAMSKVEMSCPVSALPMYEKLSVKAKEPWLMTRNEYRASENKPKLEAIQAAIKAGKPIILRTALKGTKLTKPEHLRISVSGYMQIPSGSKWLYLTDSQVDQLADQAGVIPTPFEERKYHKAIVEEALSEGQSVPAMVLADYPDLQASTKDIEPESEVNAELYDYLRKIVRDKKQERDWDVRPEEAQRDEVHFIYDSYIRPHLKNVVGPRFRASNAKEVSRLAWGLPHYHKATRL